MASPVVTTLSRSTRKVVIQVTWKSAGSDDQTNTVLYDSSAQAALIPTVGGTGIPDPLTCTLNKVWWSNNSAAAVMTLNFDASSPVEAISIPKFRNGELDFACFGGLKNTSGSGKTGDITLTTTGIAAGESVTLVLEVLPY